MDKFEEEVYQRKSMDRTRAIDYVRGGMSAGEDFVKMRVFSQDPELTRALFLIYVGELRERSLSCIIHIQTLDLLSIYELG